MTARAPRPVPPAEDPVLRAIARAPIVPFTEDEERMLEEAEAETHRRGGRTVSHDELVAALRAHHGVTPEEWDAASDDAG
jgi:hypothetical protein